MPDAAAQPLPEQDLYFAKKTGRDFLDAVHVCEKNWLYTTQERGLWRLWWLIYCQVLGIDPGSGEQNVNQQIRFVDEEARYMMFRVQLTRVLIQQKLMLAQDQRPSFEGVASNNNAASLAKVNMASKAIDYVLTESKLEQRATGALESNGYFGGGGLHLSWNYGGGRMVDAQEQMKDPEGNPVTMPDAQGIEQPQMQKVKKRSGAPKIDKLYPWQQVVDAYQEDDHSWVIIKTPVNKYELAAKFPERYNDIVKLSIDAEMGDDALFAWGSRTSVSSDIVVLRTLYHINCEAIPGGRMAQWCQDVPLVGCDEMLPCPLDEGLPWEPIIAGRYFCTAFGYPESSDLLAVQSALNEVMSQTLTLVQKHGNPNVYKRDDVQIDEAAYQAGGAMFDLPPGAEPPVVTKFDEMGDAPKFLVEFCQKVMPLMMGLNPTVQGQPESNITSGAFGVLLVNLAQKFANQLQQAYDFALTGISNKSLELVKKNASNGFWAEVTGKADGPYLELFKTEDLQDFHSVKLVRRNPIMSTLMGRVEIFDRTWKLPKKERAEAMELLLDSRTDAYAENDQSSMIRIRKENEQMLVGIKPTVSWSDPHPLEVQKHNAERDKLRSQDPPEDPQAYEQWIATINLFDQHATEHASIWATTPIPMLLAAGTPPLQMIGTGAPPPEGDKADTGAGPGGGAVGEPAGPGMPNAPKPPAAAEGAGAGNV
jgi:hypothetical protein